MKALLVLVALTSAACSGNASPASPTPPTPPAPVAPPVSAAFTITGRVTATNGAQPLSGVAVTLGPASFVSDPTGAFQTMFPVAQGALRVTLEGIGIVPRTAFAAANSARQLMLDAIALSGGFDPAFYRQLVRNTMDAPTTLEPLRRWTVNPSFYMKVTDEAGVTMDAKTLDNTEQVIRAFVPQWTAGRFAVATFERGTTTRALASGWINVNWSNMILEASNGSQRCGDAGVAQSPGTINLYYKANKDNGSYCRCPGQSEMGSRVISHELGHAMGFWHAGSGNDVMFPGGGNFCDATLSARERYHAAIAYARPVGNVEPDTDPTSAVLNLPHKVVF